MLCRFLPSTIDKIEFDSVQTHVLNKIPKNARKTISVNLQYFRCTGGRPKKPSFSNGRGPVDLPGCKRGKSHGSKKLPAEILDSSGTLKFDTEQFKAAVLSACDALWFTFFQTKTSRNYLEQGFRYPKETLSVPTQAKLRDFGMSNFLVTKNLTGLPECHTIFNTLVPHFGVISLYRVASTPNTTPNMQNSFGQLQNTQIS